MAAVRTSANVIFVSRAGHEFEVPRASRNTGPGKSELTAGCSALEVILDHLLYDTAYFTKSAYNRFVPWAISRAKPLRDMQVTSFSRLVECIRRKRTSDLMEPHYNVKAAIRCCL